ncbi:hypothetical protein CJO82_16790 (plasmid) [Ralstonia solanacearum]|nr:hypothetical protein CJO82_16790 [Ralstonia solanacearum]AXW25367.1 hypothetical protein CJO86_17040 [Ralstonia solanacearum]AXW82279.1 hypothetical protein CJO98_17150 [Ralstonia solanacearum]
MIETKVQLAHGLMTERRNTFKQPFPFAPPFEDARLGQFYVTSMFSTDHHFDTAYGHAHFSGDYRKWLSVSSHRPRCLAPILAIVEDFRDLRLGGSYVTSLKRELQSTNTSPAPNTPPSRLFDFHHVNDMPRSMDCVRIWADKLLSSYQLRLAAILH